MTVNLYVMQIIYLTQMCKERGNNIRIEGFNYQGHQTIELNVKKLDWRMIREQQVK